MKKPISISLVILFATVPTFNYRKTSTQAQRILKCEDAKVIYTPFDEGYAKHLVLQDVSNSENPPQNAKKNYSPNRNMWMAVILPDTSKPGPWITQIYFGSDGDEEVWKLTTSNAIGSDAKWLNEKLVFGQIWWGRTYATEFVLDLQQHKFLYREMANYAGMTEACQ